MGDPIAHSANILEWNLLQLGLGIFRKVSGSLTNNRKPHRNSVSLLTIIPEGIKGNSSHVAQYQLGGFQHILQICFLRMAIG